MTMVGLDIGGANIKGATQSGDCVTVPFQLWKHPDQLGAQVRKLLSRWEIPELIAVTLTAELADCYATKKEGVTKVLEAVQEAAGRTAVRVWSTSGKFLNVADALEQPMEVAAGNWHALATWAGRFLPDPASLLIDIGSTTTDLIPLRQGEPQSHGFTDSTRMIAGELVYTGVRRTPLCALVKEVPFHQFYCPVAAELFATTLDVYLMTGDLPEDVNDTFTANGRPATREEAHDRLARQLCCDRTEFSRVDAELLARNVAQQQLRKLEMALNKVTGTMPACHAVLLAGSGSFLARRLASEHPKLKAARRVELSRHFHPDLSAAAAAYAVATLAAERLA